MKKTLITLVALSGLAMAAATSNMDTEDARLKAYINFETTGASGRRHYV